MIGLSFFSVLFTVSTSVVALFFAVLGIARSLQEKDRYFPSFVLKYCKNSLLLLYTACLASLISFLLEEVARLGFRIIAIEGQWSTNLSLIWCVILSTVFASGLILMGLSVKELLKRLFPKERKKTAT